MRKFNIKVNGTSYAVEVEEIGGGSTSAPAQSVAAPAAAPVVKPAAPAAPAGGAKVDSPMPGDVRKLCVADGATVKAGDKIIVLEAMKMENDIVTPHGGTITYAVKEGDHVDSGAVIAYIK